MKKTAGPPAEEASTQNSFLSDEARGAGRVRAGRAVRLTPPRKPPGPRPPPPRLHADYLLPLPRARRVAELRERHAERRDVLALQERGARPGRVVHEIPARGYLPHVARVGLGIHGDHDVDLARAGDVAVAGDADLVPGRQALDVGREIVLAHHRDAAPEDRLHEQRVGARRAGAVHRGDLDGEVVDARGGRLRHGLLQCQAISGLARLERAGFVLGVRPGELRLLHVPRRRRAAVGAQSAVHGQILVLHHHPPGLRERGGHVQRLRQVPRRRLETRAQLRLGAVLGDGETVDRTDVETRVTLDAELRDEDGLYVAVEAALHLLLHLLRREAELDLDVELLEALLVPHVRHQPPLDGGIVVGVAPLVHAHLAAVQIHAGGQPLAHRLALALAGGRDRGLVAALARPHDVLRSQRGIAPRVGAG